MKENIFRFKQFAVRQQNTAMKVGTDGVLLGAWADFGQANSILDIGTGTGVIALMVAQRMLNACVDAVEIDRNAYEEACFNVKESCWNDRIRVFHDSILNYQSVHLYDSIICNPPFFENSTLNPTEERTQARHCIQLTHCGLLQRVSDLLSETGHFNLILPIKEALKVELYAHENSLFVTRKTYVLPTPQKMPKRILMELSKIEQKCEEKELIIELERHKYSEEYRYLTSNFYLNV